MFSKLSPLFLLFAFVALLSSCSSSGDDVTPVTIEGTWNLSGADIHFDDAVIPASQDGLDASFLTNATYTFNSDGSVSAIDTDGDSIVGGTYTFDSNSNKLVITELFEGDTYTYNYEVKLTENTLELESSKVDLLSEDFSNDEEINVFFLILALIEDIDEAALEVQVDPNAATAFVTLKFTK